MTTAVKTHRILQHAVVQKHCFFLFYFGTVIRETVNDQHADDLESREALAWVRRRPTFKVTVTFCLPFTSSRVDFREIYGIGSPSYAMVITHVIEPCSELGQWIEDIMLKTQDTADLNKLFSTNKLSIYCRHYSYNLFNVSL